MTGEEAIAALLTIGALGTIVFILEAMLWLNARANRVRR